MVNSYLFTAVLIVVLIMAILHVITRIRWRIKQYFEDRDWKKEKARLDEQDKNDAIDRIWRNVNQNERDVWALQSEVENIKEALKLKEDKKNVKKKKRN